MDIDLSRHPGELVIGSSDEAGVVLDAGHGIAARHARLKRNGGPPILEALDPDHVTEVNGVEIKFSPIEPGDVLRFGQRLFEFTGTRLEPLADRGEISFDQVHVSRDSRPVLHDLSFLIPSRSMAGIIGPSGCGKSTLVETMLGERRPDRGRAGVSRGARIGYVPQDDVLHPALTVGENLRQRLRIQQPDIGPDETRRRIDDILARCGPDLAATRDQRVDTLSGGQRKRVNVALELLATPDILLLDEPTTGLDQSSQQAIIDFLGGIQKRTTVVCVTHALETLRFFKQIILLRTVDPADPGPSIAYHGEADEPAMREALDLRQLADAFAIPDPRLSVRAPARPPATDLAAPAAVAAPPAQHPRHAAGHALLVLDRCLKTLRRNRLNAALTLTLPLLVGALIFLSQAQQPRYGVNRVLLLNTHLFTVIAGLWLGMTLTVREIVGETAIARRDHRHGLSATGYLAGKIAYGAFVGLPQALILAGTILLLHLLKPFGLILAEPVAAPAATAVFVLVTWLVITAGAVTGLIISAIARSQSFAVTLLPLLLIPHLLFNIAAYNDPRGSYHDGAAYNPPFTTPARDVPDKTPNAAGRIHFALSMPLISRPAVNLLEASAPTHPQFIGRDSWGAEHRGAFQREWIWLATLLAAYVIALVLAFRHLGPFPA